MIISVWAETFCLTLSEAQALGVPLIVSDIGALRERIIDGKTGFLIPPGDSNALEMRLRELANDPNSLQPIIEGLKNIKIKTLNENVVDYHRLYSELLGNEGDIQPFSTPDTSESGETEVPSFRSLLQKGLTSIVILTYNELSYTKKCIRSIQKHTPIAHEIIFVDNGSRDGTVRWLRNLVQENSNYKLIENERNLGFAKGCNQGILESSGEYILLLNNDVVVTDGWLSGMLECLNSSTETGIVGPMTNNVTGLQKIENSGYVSVDHFDDYAKSFRERYRYRRIPSARLVGFCMMFRRKLVESIDLIDERFGTGGYEDQDYCLRAELEGYRNLIAGDVFI